MPAQHTVDRYRDALLALMPPGDLAREPDADLAKLAEGCVVELAGVDETATALEQSRVPLRAPGFLGTWEQFYGLPDPYAATLPTTDDARRAAIVRKINAPGDHARATYDAAAAALGLTITEVSYYAPFEAGRSRAGDPVRSDDWLWRTDLTVTSPTLDATAVASFLGVVNRDLKRAHTLIVFSSNVGLPGDEGVVDGSNNRVIDGSGNRVVP
jgi:uncharacterized protein YmfQ (DUF2313 family)